MKTERQRENDRRYYYRHRDRLRERRNEAKKRYYYRHRDRNRERRNETNRQSYQRNKDRVRAYYKRNRTAILQRSLIYAREYRKKYPEKIKEIRRKSYMKHKGKSLERKKRNHRVYTLKQYGLTQEAYNRMLQEREGKCDICSKTETRRALSVDHRHVDGMVRGLLCGSCNVAIGLFKENPIILKRAAEYLVSHNERACL